MIDENLNEANIFSVQAKTKKPDEFIVEAKEESYATIYPHGEGSDYILPKPRTTKKVPVHNTVGNEPFKDKEYIRHHFHGKKNVNSLSKSLRSGKNLPAMMGIKHPEDASKTLIIDGNHRRHAHQMSGKKTAKVDFIDHSQVYLRHSRMSAKNCNATPLIHFRKPNGTYDMDLRRKELRGKALKHYFVRTDGTHSFNPNRHSVESNFEMEPENVMENVVAANDSTTKKPSKYTLNKVKRDHENFKAVLAKHFTGKPFDWHKVITKQSLIHRFTHKAKSAPLISIKRRHTADEPNYVVRVAFSHPTDKTKNSVYNRAIRTKKPSVVLHRLLTEGRVAYSNGKQIRKSGTD